MDSLVENFGAEVDNFRFNGQEMKLLGDTIRIGKDETELVMNRGKWICEPNSNMKIIINKISGILEGWAKRFYFPTVFARSLAAKTYLSSQLLHLFSNAFLVETCLQEIQKRLINM